MHQRGFTLIELLIVIAIIGILSVIVLSSITSSRDRAAINSMKTTMQSVRTALEMCTGTGSGTLISGTHNSGSLICSGEMETYPQLPQSCGSLLYVTSAGSGPHDWNVTTNDYCRGCRIECTVEGCQMADEETVGVCGMRN
jgi:prepilin-type N-terminal cleavage/methylation domain-containing protein